MAKRSPLAMMIIAHAAKKPDGGIPYGKPDRGRPYADGVGAKEYGFPNGIDGERDFKGMAKGGMAGDDADESDREMEVQSGEELASALESKDGGAIYDAICAIFRIEEAKPHDEGDETEY